MGIAIPVAAFESSSPSSATRERGLASSRQDARTKHDTFSLPDLTPVRTQPRPAARIAKDATSTTFRNDRDRPTSEAADATDKATPAKQEATDKPAPQTPPGRSSERKTDAPKPGGTHKTASGDRKSTATTDDAAQDAAATPEAENAAQTADAAATPDLPVVESGSLVDETAEAVPQGVPAFVAAPPAPAQPVAPPSGAPPAEQANNAVAGKSVTAEVPTTTAEATSASDVPDLRGAEVGLADAKTGGERFAALLDATASGGANAGAIVPGTASTTAKAAEPQAAIPQTGPSQAASQPVPIGAVPMTIGLRSLQDSNRFEIRLDPAELGRIEVKLDIDKKAGTVSADLVVDRPATLALLQRDAGALQQALSQAGLDASGGINLSLRDGNASGGQNAGGGQGRSQSGAPAQTQAADPTEIALSSPMRAVRLSGLDIRI